MKCISFLAAIISFGFLLGMITENHKLHHQEKYFINNCIDNNQKYSEADRITRCQQAYKLFTNKRQLN